MASSPLVIHWFRRDLRLEDNAALWAALRSGLPVIPLFIFDRDVLDHLDSKADARVAFIHGEIASLQSRLRQMGSDLVVRYGRPQQVFAELLEEFEVKQVFTNRDYEPYAIARDKGMYEFFTARGVRFSGKKDHVIFEKDEILKDDGKPYTVYTPYSRKWKHTLSEYYLKPYPSESYFSAFQRFTNRDIPSLGEMGFSDPGIPFPPREIPLDVVAHYAERRDLPAVAGTSRLSLHLRFGTVSIRKLASTALHTSEKWLNELIWRDFYQAILYHFPHTVDHAFKPAYDRIPWRNDPEGFRRWCEGKTGYPLVDAGMRELNATGFMHNRVRMVVASFLTKHLLIDWRLGERYFASKLLDFELASNVGGWQWAAGSGCDAAPYFRVFNPQSQQEKFDPQFMYIRKWVPEFGTPAYPKPMIPHPEARERCLTVFKEALREG
jgi:deoxyribodipyrimidine photo-lyase